jgi:hypothetical protein
VTARSDPLRRPPSERLAAWLVTGPLGHLYSVLADLTAFGAQVLWRRVRRWS